MHFRLDGAIVLFVRTLPVVCNGVMGGGEDLVHLSPTVWLHLCGERPDCLLFTAALLDAHLAME